MARLRGSVVKSSSLIHDEYHEHKPQATRLSGIKELNTGVHDYVHYYNNARIKLRLKGLSPLEYRLRNTA